GNLGGLVAADPRVHPDPIPYRATEQRVHRYAVRLPGDVPQRLIETGHRAGEYGSTAVEAALGEHMPVVFDPPRVLSDQVLGEHVDRGPYDLGAPFDDRLAPAHQAVVGGDAAEQPSGWDQER